MRALLSIHWTAPRGRFQTARAIEQNFGWLREANFVQRLWAAVKLCWTFQP